MKLSCAFPEIVSALKKVRATVSPYSTLEILECVLVSADQETGLLTLSTSNLADYVSVEIAVTVEEAGAVATPLKALLACLSQLGTCCESTQITLSDNGECLMVLAPHASPLPLKRVSADAFPRLPKLAATEELVRLPSRTFKTCIAQVLFAAALGGRGPLRFSSVWIEVSTTGAITFVATDQVCFATHTVQAEIGAPQTAGVFAILASTLKDLLPVLPSTDEPISVRVDASQFIGACVWKGSTSPCDSTTMW